MNPDANTKNKHFNLFRFFHESEDTIFIENNLSRAFALCLNNSSFFFNEYLRGIVSAEDYAYLVGASSSHSEYNIDLQIRPSNIEVDSFRKVYAVAMTSSNDLDMDDFLEQKELPNRDSSITDILISIKDIAIVIEVKKGGEDCKRQLYNQILPFRSEESKIKIAAKACSWSDVIRAMETVTSTQSYFRERNTFLTDFLTLSESKYPQWFNPKPFSTLQFNSHWNSASHAHLLSRMRQALNGLYPKYDLLGYNDRLGLSIPFGWASEMIPGFESYNNQDYVGFYMWPGNTKAQGRGLYNKPLEWTKQKELEIEGKAYELDIAFNVKFCHFNRFISQLNFYQSDVLENLHTRENYDNISGKWDYDDWDEFEQILDGYFKPKFEWRKQCSWEENFRNTDRSYFTMSLGFEVAVYIPYREFQDIDKSDKDIKLVSFKIDNIIDALKKLIN